MPPRFTGLTYPALAAEVSQKCFASLADLRRAGYEPFGRDFRSQPI